MRDTAGRIVKHLKPVEVQHASEAALSVGQRVIRFAKANPVAVGVGVAAALALGSYAYLRAAAKKKRVYEIDASGLDRSMAAYIQALQDGDLTIGVVDDLLEEIETLESIAGSATVRIELTGDDLKQLVTSVHKYTVKLVEGNADLQTDAAKFIPSAGSDILTDLKGCLHAQKSILQAA